MPTIGDAGRAPTVAGPNAVRPESITGILITAATGLVAVRVPAWTADMSRSALDREWDDLMALCRREADLKRSAEHPKLLRLVCRQIDIAAQMLGFGGDEIRLREFRAEKEDGRVVRILTRQSVRTTAGDGDHRDSLD